MHEEALSTEPHPFRIYS
jgi:hypothetical protein